MALVNSLLSAFAIGSSLVIRGVQLAIGDGDPAMSAVKFRGVWARVDTQPPQREPKAGKDREYAGQTSFAADGCQTSIRVGMHGVWGLWIGGDTQTMTISHPFVS